MQQRQLKNSDEGHEKIVEKASTTTKPKIIR